MNRKILIATLAFTSLTLPSYATTIFPQNYADNYNQINSGKQFCRIAKQQNKLIKACMPILNADTQDALSIQVEGEYDHFTVAPNAMYGIYKIKIMNSIIVTVTNKLSQKIIYSGKSIDMQGLKCNANYCVPWN